MNKLRSTKGITLVALVVTIIVLIILAGVSISLVLGQDGVVQKAKQGRDNYADAARLENEQLANVDAFAMGIESMIPSTPTQPEEPETPVDTNKYIKFSDNTKEVISGNQSLKAKYGTTVDSSFFSSNENTGNSSTSWQWQLFYDDESYIFLIASDYVPVTTLPAYGNTGYSTTTGNLYKTSGINSTYNATFCSNTNYNDYVLNTSSIYNSGAQAASLKGTNKNPLVDNYLHWIALNPNCSNYNIKAVAFMMDTNKWSQFANDTTHNYANSFAIGGPTIELLVKSYNAYPGNSSMQVGGYDTMTSGTNYDSYGYKVWRRTTNTWEDWGDHNDLGDNTSMWAITSREKADGYWLASPGYRTNNGYYKISSCNYDHYIGCDLAYAAYNGFRPVVVIPKASL